MEKATLSVHLEWPEIKNRYLSLIAEGNDWPQDAKNAHNGSTSRLLSQARPERLQRHNDWIGCSPADMLNWLRNGYKPTEIANSAAYVPKSYQKRPTWSEEDGDIDVGRLYGGYDSFLLDRAEQETRSGLKLVIDVGFASSIQAETIRAYGAWIAGFIRNLEIQGHDLEVMIRSRMLSMFGQHHHGRLEEFLITVKHAQEKSDFTEWSALFSPGGYRTLILYVGQLMAGDKIDKWVPDGHGTTLTNIPWKVEYDKKEQTVYIQANQRGYESTEEVMSALSQSAKETGLLN